jgi:outer membrane immunogenic protein
MRRLFIATILLGVIASLGVIVSVGSAAAADWMGWSFGISGGGGTGNSSQTDSGLPCAAFGTCCPKQVAEVKPQTPQSNGCSPPPCNDCNGDGSYRMGGGLIGAGFGFNFWQSGPWVAGVAGDLSWADISGSSGVCGANSPLPHACGTTLQSLGTARGVIGYAPGPYWLVYGTAGYAGGDIHAWDSLAGGGGTSLLSGWTAGAGIEALISQNLSVKFEYLHVDLGHSGVFDIFPGVTETVGFTGDIFRVGLNLRFNAPPVPTYARPMYTK